MADDVPAHSPVQRPKPKSDTGPSVLPTRCERPACIDSSGCVARAQPPRPLAARSFNFERFQHPPVHDRIEVLLGRKVSCATRDVQFLRIRIAASSSALVLSADHAGH